MAELDALLERGGSEDSALKVAAETIERFAKRLEAAKSIEIQERNSITIRDARAMVAGIFAILDRHGSQGRTIADEMLREVFSGSNIDMRASTSKGLIA